MRVAQMILVRVLVLEDLAAHVAFNLVVWSVYISHMSCKFGTTDILVTFTAVHFACNNECVYHVPAFISDIFRVSFAGGTSGSQRSYRLHYNGHTEHSLDFGAGSLCDDLYLLCVQTSHNEGMLHVCWLAHLEWKALSQLRMDIRFNIACSDICHAPPSGACLGSPCSCKPHCSAGTALLLLLCAEFWHVWSDSTYGSTSHNTRMQQTWCQARLEKKAWVLFRVFIYFDKHHVWYVHVSLKNPSSCTSLHNTDTSDLIQLYEGF